MQRSMFALLMFVFVTAGLTSCSTASRRNAEAEAKEAAKAAAAEALPAPTAPASAPADAHAAAPAAHGSHGGGHAEVTGVEPQTALKWMKNGNKRFVKSHARKDGQSMKDVARLSTGQKPHTIVVSCSDSRVPPEIVFDQKLGEIFVVRTAGEALDANVIGSIEYAVEHFGSRLIMVLGHTQCGAVKAALQTMNGGDAGSPSLNKLVADIHPRLRPVATPAGPSKDVSKESWANARGVADDLLVRSEILKNAVASGKVVIQPALYHLDTGAVEL